MSPSRIALPALLALALALPAAAQKPDVIPHGNPGGSTGPVERAGQDHRSTDFRTGAGIEFNTPYRPHGEARRKEPVAPPPTPRCDVHPGHPRWEKFWRKRDLLDLIQAQSRRGLIPVVATDPEATEIVDWTWWPAGWRAYSFLVAPEGELHVRLHHPKEGWFRLQMMNKWGSLEAGMLRNLIPTGNPEVFYKNPRKEWRMVYVLVDDPAWWSDKSSPYTLKITRSWDPRQRPAKDLPQVVGIWAAAPREALEQIRPKDSFAAPPVEPPAETAPR